MHQTCHYVHLFQIFVVCAYGPTSLPNLLSPKDVQNFYWLCLQEHLILANSQEPFRLILRSPENNCT